MENDIFQLQYALDTFYFLVCGALVMWMAAGFAMLEAGLVQSKNTVEILTKNVTLFAVASIMYMVCGYGIMYGGDIFLSSITGSGVVEGEDPATYAPSADFYCLWGSGRTDEVIRFPGVCGFHDGVHLPDGGKLDLGR